MSNKLRRSYDRWLVEIGARADMGIKKGFLGSRREEIIEDLYNQVKELEAKYRKLYEGSPEMYRTIDIDGFIIDCNQAYVDSLGFTTKSEVLGHLMFEHTAEKSLDAMRKSFTEWQLVGHVRNKEIWLKRRDGSIFPALINATSLFDNNGRLVGSNTVITDMTEIQESRQRLQEANEALKKAHELREDFIRVAAHDLRNPIQPILMAAEMAKKNLDQRELALDIIIREARRLKQLANDFLDVSKIETGSVQYEMSKVPASDIVKEIIEEASLIVENNNGKDAGQGPPIKIAGRMLHNGKVELRVDRHRMMQAFLNLVNNAVKFTKKGQITIESRLNEQELFEIRIIDSGPGIPRDILPRLFEKFATKNPDSNSKNNGTGLGLFICKSIISAHGGSISAANNADGSGATFVVTLPIG